MRFWWHFHVASLLLRPYSPPNPRVLFSDLGFSRSMFDCHLKQLGASGAFWGQALSWSDSCTLRPSMSGGWVVYVINVYCNSMHCLYDELSSAPNRWIHTRAAVAAQVLSLMSWDAEHPNLRDAFCLLTIVQGMVSLMPCLGQVRWVASRELSTIVAFVSRFFPFLRCSVGACGVVTAICKAIFFLTWAYAGCFNNNICTCRHTVTSAS